MSTKLSRNAATVFLGVVVTICVLGAIYLAALDKTLPGEVIAIGSAAGGALATMATEKSTL